MNIDYSQFLNMIPEVSLTALLLIVFIADFFTATKPGDAPRKWFNPLVCVLLTAHVLLNISTPEAATTFGGMYYTNAAVGVIKTILAFGTLIVLIQSREWMLREDTLFKEGEFYLLVISTLLGMNVIISSATSRTGAFFPRHVRAWSPVARMAA